MSPEARVSSVTNAILLNEVVQISGDDHFGLHAGAKIGPDPANLIYYLFMNSPTLGEGLGISAKYFHQYSDSLFATIEHEETVVRVCLGSFEALPTFPRQINEWILATWVAMARRYAGQSLSPLKVYFTNKAPKNTRVLEDFFSAPVAFDQPNCELHFSRSHMSIQPQAGPADLALRNIMERQIQEQLERSAGSDQFLWRLREEVANRMAGKDADLPTVARVLGLSGRSLQRKLKDRGTSYRNIVEATQKRFGVDLLRDERLTLEEISHRLGFSNQAAFHRAFHRWFDATPTEFRWKMSASASIEPPAH